MSTEVFSHEEHTVQPELQLQLSLVAGAENCVAKKQGNYLWKATTVLQPIASLIHLQGLRLSSFRVADAVWRKTGWHPIAGPTWLQLEPALKRYYEQPLAWLQHIIRFTNLHLSPQFPSLWTSVVTPLSIVTAQQEPHLSLTSQEQTTHDTKMKITKL